VVAPAGERFRTMRKRISKLFLSDADSLLTRVSAVQVRDTLAHTQAHAHTRTHTHTHASTHTHRH
jgi:hypothetical protein